MCFANNKDKEIFDVHVHEATKKLMYKVSIVCCYFNLLQNVK